MTFAPSIRTALIGLLGSVLLLAAPISFASPDCPSVSFVIRKGNSVVPFDVATLRRTRPELYEILQQRVVRDLYFGQDMTGFVNRMSQSFNSLPGREGWPKEEDQRQRFINFFVHGALRAFEELTLACGSFVDGVAAELSLAFTQDESTRLAKIVADPLHEKFLVFMLRMKSGHKVPEELNEYIDRNLLPAFRADLIVRCMEAGVAEETCARFKIGPMPKS